MNINGCTDSEGIANEFAKHFQSVFCCTVEGSNAMREYDSIRSDCLKSNDKLNIECVNCDNVELVDRCIRRLKKGKAGGPDNLCAEHLMYAHPAVVIHLQLLFRLILSHGFVPDKFGHGISIPLIKDKTGNLNDTDNYRAITLSSVIL